MIRTLAFRAMGCQMLAALDSDSPQAERRLASVPVWFEEWEQSLSRFRPDSELNELNRRAGQAWAVSATLWSVFQASIQAEQRSQGLVTPQVLGALLHAGYDRSFEALPADGWAEGSARSDGRGSAMPVRTIAWDAGNRQIYLPPGVGLDFGGVAKGWAAQQAVRRLRAYGPALVDAGGDIAISGLQRDGEGWPVGVADPFQPGADIGVLNLASGGVATSGIDYRRWQQGGAWKHHIIDPRTGQPAETDLLSVTVIAPSLLEAEMAAKTALISGSQDGLAWLAAQPGLEGLLVLQSRQQLFTHNFWSEHVKQPV